MSKPLPFLVSLVMLSVGPALATEPSAVRLHPRFQPCDDASCRAVSIAPKPQGCAKGECGPGDGGAYDVSTLPTAVVVPLYGSSNAVAQQLASLSRTRELAGERFALVADSEKNLFALVEAAWLQRHQATRLAGGQKLVERAKRKRVIQLESIAIEGRLEARPTDDELQGVRDSQPVRDSDSAEVLLLDVKEWMGEPVSAQAGVHAGFITGSLPVLVKGRTAQLNRALARGVESLDAASPLGLDVRLKAEASEALSQSAERQLDDGLIEKILRLSHEGLSGDGRVVHVGFSLGMWMALALDSGGAPPAGFSALGRNLASMLEKHASLRGERWMARAVRGIAAELDKGASRSQEAIRAHARSLLAEPGPEALSAESEMP